MVVHPHDVEVTYKVNTRRINESSQVLEVTACASLKDSPGTTICSHILSYSGPTLRVQEAFLAVQSGLMTEAAHHARERALKLVRGEIR